MSDRIEGRVATVLNEREVAINVGSKDGVQTGMRFAILSEYPIRITDPGSDELLGEIDRPKVRVKVSEVNEKFSVARTYETYEVNVGGAGLDITGIAIFGRPPKWVTKVKTLRVDESDLPGELTAEESIVKVNDRVVQIVDDQDSDEEDSE